MLVMNAQGETLPERSRFSRRPGKQRTRRRIARAPAVIVTVRSVLISPMALRMGLRGQSLVTAGHSAAYRQTRCWRVASCTFYIQTHRQQAQRPWAWLEHLKPQRPPQGHISNRVTPTPTWLYPLNVPLPIACGDRSHSHHQNRLMLKARVLSSNEPMYKRAIPGTSVCIIFQTQTCCG